MPAYQAMQQDGKLGSRMLEILLHGVSTRQYKQVFWDGKRREVKAVIRHQMQCLAHYFLGKRSRYEPFRFDAVKKPLAEKGQLSLTLPSAC